MHANHFLMVIISLCLFNVLLYDFLLGPNLPQYLFIHQYFIADTYACYSYTHKKKTLSAVRIISANECDVPNQ